MSTRPLAWLLAFAAMHALAAPPADKPEPAPAKEVAPEDIDVDALARAKDVDASAEPAASEETAANAAEPPKEQPAEATETPAQASPAEAAAATAEPADAAAAAPVEEAATPAEMEAPALAKPPVDPQDQRAGASCEARSTSLLDAAQKGDFETATHDFDAKMRSALPPAKFKQMWSSLDQFGTLTARGQAHPGKGEGYYLVMTPLLFEKATLVAQVACGADGRIAGFYIKPLSAVQ